MSTLSNYESRFDCAALRRIDGILEIRLHSDGGPFIFGTGPHGELPQLFREVGDDLENRVVILTGTGDLFSGAEASPETRIVTTPFQPAEWYLTMREAKQMLLGELDIDVPMIAAVNGPAFRHMEIALLCDIVIASEDAVFEDAAHILHGNLVPGDGMNLVLGELMGINRARYLHLTGQRLNAAEAQSYGMVNEVLPKADVLERAWELARDLVKKPDLLLRHSRLAMTHRFKQLLGQGLSEHLLYEGLAQLDPDDPARRPPSADA